MNEPADALRRFGDRMDWVFPPEPAPDLLPLIAPLFHAAAREAAAEAEKQDGEIRYGPALLPYTQP